MGRKKKNEIEQKTDVETTPEETTGHEIIQQPVEGNSDDTTTTIAEPEKEKTVDEILAGLDLYKDAPPDEQLPPIKKERKKRETKPKPGEQPPAFVVPGRLVVKAADSSITSLLVLVDRLMFQKKSVVKVSDLSLTLAELESLAPAAEAMLKQWKIADDPTSVFFGSLAAIYLGRYMLIKGSL